ncbi:MAG: ATP-binding protein, partial [Ktedonobacterales bacterium]
EKLIPPSLRAGHLDGVMRYLATGERRILGERVEMTAMRADGSEFPAEMAVCQIPQAGPPMFTMYLRDITGRQRLENEVAQLLVKERRSHMEADARASQLVATFDAIADGVFVYDNTERILHTNQADRALFPSDLPAGDFPTTLHERARFLTVVDESGQSLPREQWPTFRTLRGETFTGATALDMRLRHLGGEEMLVSIAGSPVRDNAGHIIGGVVVWHNVTERRHLERHTRDALTALLAMAETLVQPPDDLRATGDDAEAPAERIETGLGESPVMSRLALLLRTLLDCDVAGIGTMEQTTLLMRPLAVSGKTHELERRWWSDIQHSALDETISEDDLAAVQRGEPVVQRFDDRVTTDSSRLPVNTRAIAPMFIGGTLFGGISIRHNGQPHEYSQDELALLRVGAKLATVIVERERLLREREEARTSELALRESNRRMDEFLSIASHELKTPMTSILLTLHLLQAQMRALEPAGNNLPDARKALHTSRKILKRADQQGARMNRLVEDLLDVSRIRMNRFDLRLRVCDMVGIVRDVVLEQTLPHPLRELTLDLPAEEEIAVTADSVRIEQVVTNYLTNALKYAPEDRPIAVSLRRDGHYARVVVRDSGPGLKPAEQLAIWDRFHRAEGIPVVSGSEVGLGLGLYICRTIVERHGGQVGVESILGKGSSFW